MEERLDLISTLPDEILHHIISLISFKQAVQTITLSTYWRGLMSPIHVNIYIHDATLKLKQIIESFVKSGNIFQALKLYLDLYDGPFAIITKGAHGELHFNFSAHKQLLIAPCKFNMILEKNVFISPVFSSVKILHLRSVSRLVVSFVNDLFSSCRFLESLKIEKCYGLENLELEANGNFKNFEMIDCPNIVRVVLSAQNLDSFSYRGVYTIIQLIGVPNLVDFRLNLRDGLGDNNTFDNEDVISLLFSIKDVEILTVSGWLLEALCSGGVIFSLLDFKFSKLKRLSCVCSKISSKVRDSLACFLNITPSLEEFFVEIDQTSSRVEIHPFNNLCWHEPHLWEDYATVKRNARWLKHLQLIKIIGSTREKDELLLMDLLLHNAINLKEMIVVSTQDDCSWRVAKIPYSHIKYLKMKYVLINCPDKDSYFVLTEYQNYCLKSQIVKYF